MIIFPSDIPLPLVSDFSDQTLSESIIAETISGVGRVERKYLQTPTIKRMTWRLGQADAEKLYRFWKFKLDSGYRPFRIRLEGPNQYKKYFDLVPMADSYVHEVSDTSKIATISFSAFTVDNSKVLVSTLYPLYQDEEPSSAAPSFADMSSLSTPEETSSNAVSCESIQLDNILIDYTVYDEETSSNAVSCESIQLDNILIDYTVYDEETSSNAVSCESIQLADILITVNMYDEETSSNAVSCTEITLQ